MRIRQTSFLYLLLAIIILAGCNSGPKIMRFEMPVQSPQSPILWPPEPEPPRYVYLGDITGEENFHIATGETRKGFTKLWRVITGIEGSNSNAQVLQRPQGGVTTDDGRIFVTDVGRKAVFAFDEVNGTLEIWEQATLGRNFVSPIGIAYVTDPDSDPIPTSGNKTDAQSDNVASSVKPTTSRKGYIYVADSQLGQVFIFNSDGKPVGNFGENLLQWPTGLAWDSAGGRLYVADTKANNIKVFTREGELLDVIGDEGDKKGFFNSPTYLTFSDGELYVSDTLNAHIQVFSAEGDYLRTIGSRGMYIGQFSRPKGIAIDSDKNVYSVESYYDHLIIFNQSGQLLLTIGGTGQSAGKFYLPSGLWIDNRNRIFIADMLNGRITVFKYLGND